MPASQPSEPEGERLTLTNVSGQTVTTSKSKPGMTSLQSTEAVDAVWKQESVTTEDRESDSEESLTSRIRSSCCHKHAEP